ncbi:hypothetical protein SS50377_21268 [Spironucleus salmonicida]|uniref:Uncharacterized protein n=1 Tax=Spironucleus salmonicida TaxID=348837 RepID=V6LI94_9EUKA|nr:hypothetical protein SS50377_21268 [Spironucleus salmonicida]|eukprot:EST44038.1 Hypothetical protein SS50377_16348 [Spironucleus salmonicida]
MDINSKDNLDDLFEGEKTGFVVDFKPEYGQKCEEHLKINDILKIERNLTALKRYRNQQTPELFISANYSFNLYKRRIYTNSQVKVSSPKKTRQSNIEEKIVPIRNINSNQLYLNLRNRQIHTFELPILEFGGMTVKTLADIKQSRQCHSVQDNHINFSENADDVNIFLTNSVNQ